MKKVLALLSFAALAAACSSSPEDPTRPRSESVDGRNGDRPNHDEAMPEEDDPEQGEGPTCNDPMAVIPDGWTEMKGDGYTWALPPGSRKNTEKASSGRIWYVRADEGMGGVVGVVIVGPTGESTLDQTEEKFRTKIAGTREIRRDTHECREDLVVTLDLPNNTAHHVVVGGRVIEFACELYPEYEDLCAQFFGAFHIVD